MRSLPRRAALAACLAGALAPLAADPAPAPRRVVTLIPSLAEDVYALGAGSRLVGVSQFTDYPPQARSLPRVASVASVDAERIVALHPDLVVGISAQRARVAPLERVGLRVALFGDDRFEDIFRTIEGLGALLDAASAAARLERELRVESARLERGVDRRRRPRVFVVLGVAPIYTVGERSYLTTLVRMAGGTNAARLSAAYAGYSPEALLLAQPDVLIADPAVGLRGVLDREPWRSLAAVRRGAVAEIPNPDVLLRPGPRYNEGLRWLIETLRRVR